MEFEIILAFAVSVLAIVIGTYGQIFLARLKQWRKDKLDAYGLQVEEKWQADLKAGLLTGAKAALLEGKTIPEAIKAAIAHTLQSNAQAATGLAPVPEVLENLAKAAVVDAAAKVVSGEVSHLRKAD